MLCKENIFGARLYGRLIFMEFMTDFN